MVKLTVIIFITFSDVSEVHSSKVNLSIDCVIFIAYIQILKDFIFKIFIVIFDYHNYDNDVMLQYLMNPINYQKISK